MNFNGWDRKFVNVGMTFLSYRYYKWSLLITSESMKDSLSSWQNIVDELSELVGINLINLDLATF